MPKFSEEEVWKPWKCDIYGTTDTPRPWVHQRALQLLSPTHLPGWQSCEKKLQGASCWASTNISFVMVVILVSINRHVLFLLLSHVGEAIPASKNTWCLGTSKCKKREFLLWKTAWNVMQLQTALFLCSLPERTWENVELHGGFSYVITSYFFKIAFA